MIRFPRRGWARKGLIGLLAGAALFLAIPKPRIVPFSLSREVYDRKHRLLRLTTSSDEKYRRWVSLSRTSPILIEAFLLQEDRLFRSHPGVNPYSLLRALWSTYLRTYQTSGMRRFGTSRTNAVWMFGTGGRRVGGSTVTMQLARMRFNIRSRTLPGKLYQILRALQIERHYSKDEILEAYLNSVPLGGNVEGVGAASIVYFGKPVHRLGLPEALALCVIPKSPARRGPAGAKGTGQEDQALAARLRLFARWIEAHPEDQDKRPLIEMPLAMRLPGELPFNAPHFAQAALEEDTSSDHVLTTLDLPVQKLAERQVRRYLERKKPFGIRNACALLVHYPSMEVMAAVGSADYFDGGIQGQVNGTRARRSPGSALKPFIYALAMDQGLVHPMSMLKDAPMNFGGFNPENFDRDFLGPLHAWEALVRSRNVPAVHLAQQLKNPSLYGFLRSAGIGPLQEESFYGLALALGGAELRMEDLVKLYSMLANGGVLKPLRTRLGWPGGPARRLLSAEASFMALDMLKDNPRPAQGLSPALSRDALQAHWKTGTSYGFRDAWSVGVFGPYVLAVWVGNFDGQGNPAFVGIEAAAPLMFEIIDALRAHEPGLEPLWPSSRLNLAKVDVCAVSGQIPGPHCRRRVPTWFIPGRSPITTCSIHREVLVDERTGLRVCAGKGPGVRSEVVEFWPSDLLKLFKLAGLPRRSPPQDGPGCSLDSSANRGIPPAITSPHPGLAYTLRAASVGRQTLAFSAVTDADARQLYWFANDRFLGRAKTGETFFWAAQPGSYVVRVVDDQGRSDSREMLVAVVE
ncbi:MAG: penicillin-binding protein 1C [Elusimicrobia bacterium]|nr:penicillin-binding protein 1C [Elusimicrobiota bacterium]